MKIKLQKENKFKTIIDDINNCIKKGKYITFSIVMGIVLLFTGCNNLKNNQNNTKITNITLSKNIQKEFIIKGNLGSVLELKDINGNVIDSWISTDNPHYITNLAPGSYTLQEQKSAEGYIKNDKIVTLKVEKNSKKVDEINMQTQTIKEFIQEELKNYIAVTTTTSAMLGGLCLALSKKRK